MVLGDGESSRARDATVRLGMIVPNTRPPPPGFRFVNEDEVELDEILRLRCVADDEGIDGRGFCCGRFIELEKTGSAFPQRAGAKRGRAVGFVC